MSHLTNKQRQHTPWGLLFQVPVFLLAAFGLYQFGKLFYYSLTDYDMFHAPSFVGFQNYAALFDEVNVRIGFRNTVGFVCAVSVLLLVTAVLPALFIAKLKWPFGAGVIAAFSVITLSTMMPNFLTTLFSHNSYGILNRLLLNDSSTGEPIVFTPALCTTIAVILLWLRCLAPVFAVTYLAAKKKRPFVGTAIALCATPVLMYSGSETILYAIGMPSVNYSADWLYQLFFDYSLVRFEIGFSHAILFVGLAMLVGWCLVICAVVYGCRRLFKNGTPAFFRNKALGYASFLLAALLFILVAALLLLYLLKAFMPTDEWFRYPPVYLPQRPTLTHFHDLIHSDSYYPLSRYVFNSLWAIPCVLLPASLLVALPSGVGWGLFRSCKHEALLLFCFVPLLFTSGYTTVNDCGMIDSYFAYAPAFLSSVEFFAFVFLVSITVKFVFYDHKAHVGGILLGIAFVLSSCHALGALRGIWYRNFTMISSENLKNWTDWAIRLNANTVSNVGIAAANDWLMLLTTLALCLLPTALFLLLYRWHRRHTAALDNQTRC